MEKPPPEIAELYRVFRHYDARRNFVSDGTIGSSEAHSKELATKPLHLLTTDDLNRYAFKAISTWGSETHFKHFLPRLFELVIIEGVEEIELTSVEVLFHKLAYGHWDSWPKEERTAVTSYLHFFWQTQLKREIGSDLDYSADTALCCLGNACKSATEFLPALTERDKRQPVRQLGRFVLHNAGLILRKRKLSNTWWDNNRAGEAEVIQWLKSPEVIEYMRRGAHFYDGHLQYVMYEAEAIWKCWTR